MLFLKFLIAHNYYITVRFWNNKLLIYSVQLKPLLHLLSRE